MDKKIIRVKYITGYRTDDKDLLKKTYQKRAQFIVTNPKKIAYYYSLWNHNPNSYLIEDITKKVEQKIRRRLDAKEKKQKG